MERSQRYVQSGIASKILHMGAVALWGGVVALCPVGDMLLPTGVAVTAAVPLSVLPAAAVGVLAALLIQGGTAALRYAAACCVLTGVRLLFGRRYGFSDYRWYEPLLAATVTLSTGVAMELSGTGTLMFLVETPLAAALSFLFSLGGKALSELGQKAKPRGPEADAAVACAALGAYSLTSLLFGRSVQGAALCILAAGAAIVLRRRCLPHSIFSPPVPDLQGRVERTAATLRELSARLSAGRSPLSPSAALTQAVDGLCRHCEHALRCWDTDAMTMEDALQSMASALSRDGRLRDDALPAPFTEHCDKRDSFVDLVNREAEAMAETRCFRESLQGAPALLQEQVKCFSLVLDDLGEGDDFTPDSALEEMLLETASQAGLHLRAGTGKQGRLRVVGEAESRPPLVRLSEAVTRGRGVALAEPSVWRGESRWHFVLSEAPVFSLSIDRQLSPAPGEKLAGDAVRDFRTDDMKQVIVLCDGMGTGRAAAGKSRLAVDTLEKLMQAGLRRDAALRVLNAALLAGEDSEVFTTLDVAIFDLYSGDLEFVKAGAAPSFILREGNLTRVDSRGMPAGLLPQWEACVTRSRVQAGDTVILLSDGLLPPGEPEGPLRDFITSFDRHHGSLARAMVSFCRKAYGHIPADDMTAVVVDVNKHG